MAAEASLGEAEAGESAGTALAVFGVRIAAAAGVAVAQVPMRRPIGGEDDGVLGTAFLPISALPERRRLGLPISAFAR